MNKNTIHRMVVGIMVLFFSVPCLGQKKTAVVTSFMHAMKEAHLDSAYLLFNETVKSKLSIYDLKQLWISIEMKSGKLKTYAIPDQPDSSASFIIVSSQFEIDKYDLKFKVDKDYLISAFFIAPPQADSYSPPTYDHSKKYRETEVRFSTREGLTLSGSLVVPVNATHCPVVILSQGSGAQDRDETIGPNKPFRDLAVGLAQEGIASYRFDKRNRMHPSYFKSNPNFTAKEEVMDDVLSAVAAIKKAEGIDSSAVFIIGHSLGGMLAPRLENYEKDIKGYILMAANSMSLQDLLAYQIDYLTNLDGEQTEAEKLEVTKFKKQLGNLKALSMDSSSASNLELPLGLPSSYWNDLLKYDQVKAVQNNPKPFLILQGKRDYQVTDKNFKLWKTGLSQRKNIKFISYPLLNHLFMEGTGEASPAEYSKPNHVPGYVIQDIATWIKTN